MRLYTYDESSVGKGIRYNCSWSAMNFFREKPDDRFVDFDYTLQAIASGYEEAHGLPTYGDVIALFTAADKPVHFSVYLADGVVFTKNGFDSMQPWVLMKLPDFLAYYPSHSEARTRVYREKRN